MNFKKHIPDFSESKFWKKLSKFGASLGQKTVYSALLLYFAYRRNETPYWAKNIVLGTLGYLISPIDFIPDLSPIIGFTDDVSLLAFGLVTISCFVNLDVRRQAKEQLARWFSNIDDDVIAEVDAQL